MRGSTRKSGKNTWDLIFDLGYRTDPTTGLRKREQKSVRFKGSKQQAQTKLTELVRAANRGEYVEPSKTTLIDYLRTWLEKSVKPPMRRPETYRVYKSIIEGHVAKASLALLPVQKVHGSDLERYFADLTVSPGSIAVHHAVLHHGTRPHKLMWRCHGR